MTDGQARSAQDIVESLLGRPPVEGAWFNRRTITLDGYDFVDCRFDGCQLHISSGNFSMSRCHIGSDTVVYFAGDIVKVIRLFNRDYDWIRQGSPFFAPKIESDGTITISG